MGVKIQAILIYKHNYLSPEMQHLRETGSDGADFIFTVCTQYLQPVNSFGTG